MSKPIYALPLCVILAVGCGSGATGIDRSDGLQVLFIGNSLTYSNDLPGILDALIDSADAGPATVAAIALGGYGLEDHWADGAAQQAIAQGRWDVIVLQQGPSATEGRPSLLEYSRRFADEASVVEARVALYMVWPATERSFDFDGVSESYTMAAEQVGGILFPAGEAWRAAWRLDAALPLYGPDGFHPSPEGSYLAALVMFQLLTGRSPIGLPGNVDPISLVISPSDPLSPGAPAFPGAPIRIPAAVASLLQEAAEEANATFGIR